MNGRLRLINLYVCLQGSVGFHGAAGVPGEKGRRVRPVLTFGLLWNINFSQTVHRLSTVFLTASLQGPAGQPGSGGQRGPNVSI